MNARVNFSSLHRAVLGAIFWGVFFAAPLQVSSLFSREKNHPPSLFPKELVQFEPVQEEPVFQAAGEGHWDAKIRERGWILKEKDQYRMWYTGYDGTRKGLKKMGYATSKDGISWKRAADKPIIDSPWVEDMMIVKHKEIYYMVAEGKGDQSQFWESKDGIKWKHNGAIVIHDTKGKPIAKGPYGTPTLWIENDVWYLFYERYDSGIWLAKSKDQKIWTNVQDDPVLKKGKTNYDSEMIALNQIIKYKGRYYAYYHGSGSKTKPRLWCPAVATSTDLIHWTKYENNPIRPPFENKSSGIIVPVGKDFRFYTMHGKVHLHQSRCGK